MLGATNTYRTVLAAKCNGRKSMTLLLLDSHPAWPERALTGKGGLLHQSWKFTAYQTSHSKPSIGMQVNLRTTAVQIFSTSQHRLQ